MKGGKVLGLNVCYKDVNDVRTEYIIISSDADSKRLKKSIIECIYFFGCRVLSLVFDMGLMFLLINILGCNEVISKIISNIFVIIINYFFSKLIIFKK